MNDGIDVSIATRNSSKTIGKCLEAVVKNLPYRKIVVVDAGSNDGTLNICRSRGVQVVNEPGCLGKVRYIQALNCETEWIALIDSDVYIYPQWWSKVSPYMNDKEIGLVNCVHDNPLSKLRIYDDFLRFFWKKLGGIAFSNTLIRRNLILECKEELEKTHAGEDSVVGSYILKKGMKNVTINQRLCFHDKDPFKHHPFACYRWGKSIRMKYGFSGPYYGGFRGIKNKIVDWCIFTTQTKKFSLKLLMYLLFLSAWTIIGFFFPQRFEN